MFGISGEPDQGLHALREDYLEDSVFVPHDPRILVERRRRDLSPPPKLLHDRAPVEGELLRGSVTLAGRLLVLLRRFGRRGCGLLHNLLVSCVSCARGRRRGGRVCDGLLQNL